MTAKVHILLVDDDPAENIILGALMRKVASYAITLHYVETVEDAQCGAPATTVSAPNATLLPKA